MNVFDDSIWNAGQCADYLGMCRKHFLRDIRFREGFPQQLEWSRTGRPKWSAQAVKQWALRQDYASAS